MKRNQLHSTWNHRWGQISIVQGLVRLLIGVLLVVILPAGSCAQTRTWCAVLVTGDTLSECTLHAVDDSVLSLERNGAVVSLPVDSLDALFRRTESSFWVAVGYGTVGGAVLGSFVGLVTSKELGLERAEAALSGGAIGAAGGFAIGAIVGAFTGGEESYLLSGKTRRTKVAVLRQVMEKEK